MSDHAHTCNSDLVDGAPGGAGTRVFMCVSHLVWSIAAALVVMGALAAFASHGLA